MAQISAKPFRLALLQLAGLNATKSNNISVARAAVKKAAESKPKPDLIVLPEIWNSPYAVTAFEPYSERVPNVKDGKEEPAKGEEGESVKALREMARENGVWVIGGMYGELVVAIVADRVRIHPGEGRRHEQHLQHPHGLRPGRQDGRQAPQGAPLRH